MTKKTGRQNKKSKKSAESKKKPKKQEKKRILKGIDQFRLLWSRFYLNRIGIGAAIVLFLYIGYCALTLPDIEKAVKATRAPQITILASDGTEIGSYGAQYGSPVELKRLPEYVPQAVIATEDRRFYSHFGVDIRSVLRAITVNLVKGRKAQGASTLTQQVAKNLFLSSEKTLRRKVQELLLSFWLEHKLTKDQILTIYLNRVYFGAGTYGIEAAAQKYYGERARRLSLYQAAVLAGLLKAPTRYNPLTHPEQANQRARVVLSNMVKAGFVSAKEALNAAETGAVAGKKRDKAVFYFTDWIADEAEAYLGRVNQDIVIKTTLVPGMQTVLDREIRQTLDSEEAKLKKVSQAAGVVMDKDGAVLAMNGGKDYRQSQFNRAVEARRQIGSAIKPFVYLTAFEKGASAQDMVEDQPVYLNGWNPKNFNNKYYGRISLHNALVHSVNTVAVATAVKTGVRSVLKTARRFGIVGSDCEANGAIALGVCQTRLIDAVSAYASLLNGGFAVTPYGIAEIVGKNGDVLYSRSDGGRARLVNPRYIAELDSALIDVIQKGTGKKANPTVLAKGKTGTTQNYRDAWFIGYTQDIAAGIWVGNDDETPMDKVTGGSFPAEIWGKVVHDISLPPLEED
ncbi:MAG: PBP1A family penicillin-binding protein [Alphaproteobacteria bacterium]|nr:PBP1A family penicillin-binding protein [Alphaproteobacteria bacterium]